MDLFVLWYCNLALLFVIVDVVAWLVWFFYLWDWLVFDFCAVVNWNGDFTIDGMLGMSHLVCLVIVA